MCSCGVSLRMQQQCNGMSWCDAVLQRLQTEIAHRGFYSFKVNATDFLDPYDPSVRSKPELYEVAMNSQLSSQLSDSTVATFGGMACITLIPLDVLSNRSSTQAPKPLGVQKL